MNLPTTQPTHADIAWYVREVESLREVLALVAKHADFSQCPPELEERVDAALPPNNRSQPHAEDNA